MCNSLSHSLSCISAVFHLVWILVILELDLHLSLCRFQYLKVSCVRNVHLQEQSTSWVCFIYSLSSSFQTSGANLYSIILPWFKLFELFNNTVGNFQTKGKKISHQLLNFHTQITFKPMKLNTYLDQINI